MGFLQNLFGRKPAIDDWVRELPNRSLIGVTLDKTLTAPPPDEDFKGFLDRRLAEPLEEKEAGLVRYPEGGLLLVPVFTDSAHIVTWVNGRPEDWEAFLFLNPVRLERGRIGRAFDTLKLERYRLIVDPGQKHERILTYVEMWWLVDRELIDA